MADQGLCGILAQILGDWKWQCEVMGLTQKCSTFNVCHTCYVTRNSFKDFQRNNPDFCKKRSHRDWENDVATKKGVLKQPPVHLGMLMRDYMHIGPLGTIPIAVGSTLQDQ